MLRRASTFRGVLWRALLSMRSFQTLPSAQPRPRPTSFQVNTTDPLPRLHTYDESPASYGIEVEDRYIELIPPNSRLPCRTTRYFESGSDYIEGARVVILGRPDIPKPPVAILGNLNLTDVRQAKKGVVKLKVTMEVGADLMGHVTIQDMWTRRKDSAELDGDRVLALLPIGEM